MSNTSGYESMQRHEKNEQTHQKEQTAKLEMVLDSLVAFFSGEAVLVLEPSVLGGATNVRFVKEPGASTRR